MRKHTRWLLATLSAGLLLGATLPAAAGTDPEIDPKSGPVPSWNGTPPGQAEHRGDPSTQNMHAMGQNQHPATFAVPDGERKISSDLAFWGDLAFQGNYDGFRVLDVSSPANPKLISHPSCNGDQGDVVVWEDILVRSWNSPRPDDRLCDGEVVPAGWEGVHIFDVSDPSDPALVGEVELPCGSHTATMAGIVDGELIVYSNNSSSFGCVDGTRAADDPVGNFMDVIAVPLDDPASATLVDRVQLAGPTVFDVRTGCHDVGVILGDVNLAAGACNDTINVWDISDPLAPDLLFTITEPGVGSVGRWHSAAFTWDGEVIVAGWEPGGGGAAECTADDPDIKKSMFFYSAENGEKLGQWVLERDQGEDENCTIHNYNIVPLRSGDYVVTGGHYQAGTWVVDFTGIQVGEEPQSVAWVDPPSLGPGPFCGGLCHIGGAWSSYFYNGVVYESDITRGLNIYRVSDSAMAGSIKLPHLNPQTQLFTLN